MIILFYTIILAAVCQSIPIHWSQNSSLVLLSHLSLTYQFNPTTNRLRDGGTWNADNIPYRIREAYHQLKRLRMEDMRSMCTVYIHQ